MGIIGGFIGVAVGLWVSEKFLTPEMFENFLTKFRKDVG